jgi:hypothetical protein
LITVNQLIIDSMRKIGVLSRGEVPSSEESADIMRDLNRMLGLWNNESLMVQGITIEEFSLVPGVDTYTLGGGGDFDTTVPIKTEAAFLKYTDGQQIEMKLVDSQKWGRLQHSDINSNTQTHIYINRQHPLQTVRIYPEPSEANKLVLHNFRKLSKVTSLTQQIDLADGYEMALVSNLAIVIAPDFGKEVSATLYQTAQEAKALIKRVNTQIRELKVDRSLLTGGRDVMGVYN